MQMLGVCSIYIYIYIYGLSYNKNTLCIIVNSHIELETAISNQT